MNRSKVIEPNCRATVYKLKYCMLSTYFGSVTVRASDLRSSGRGLDSRSGRYQAGVKVGRVHLCRVASNTV